jgi:hypothetical protein
LAVPADAAAVANRRLCHGSFDVQWLHFYGQDAYTSLRAIAAALNEKHIPTARGNGEWSAVQVQRVLERIG